ncbi:hypothetical protein GCM10017044_17700 [Kordiimonas sediminis]|uniref:Solute-binding protein family 3/N-terminal domain-containing protein n=1 Tax=Kordiimonas sediminis TaxID=1735581 RepID=A0A919AU44_9PROT|nr:hypothetical protein GCM10017044_17700 [Kordiimonas sediminis]
MYLVHYIVAAVFAASFTAAASSKDTCKVARIGVFPSWPPHYVHTKSSFEGPLVDYVSQMLQSLDIEAQALPVKPAGRLLRDMENGDVDIILAGLYSKERAQMYHLSGPLFSNTYGLIYRKDLGLVPLSEASILTFVLYRDRPVMEKIKAKGPTIIEIETLKQAAQLLEDRRADYIYSNLENMEMDYVNLGNPPGQLGVHPEFITKNSAHMTINRKWACADKIPEIDAYFDRTPYVNPALVRQ